MTSKTASETIKSQMLKAAGLKKAKTESHPEFLKRLILAIASVDDTVWESLSKESQKWYDDNVTRMNEKQDLQDFPADEPEKEETVKRKVPAAVEAADEAPPPASRRSAAPKVAPKAAAPKVAPKVAPKAVPKAAPKVAVKKAAAKKVAAPKKAVPKKAVEKKAKTGPSSLHAVRVIVLSKPQALDTEIKEKLADKHPDLTLGTIGTTRANTRSVMRLMAEKDMLKDSAGVLAKLNLPIRRQSRAAA